MLNPYKNEDKKFKEIRQWDLWGPLIFTILLSFTLSFGTDEKSDMFVLVFVIFWIGSVLVYLNGNLLGAKM